MFKTVALLSILAAAVLSTGCATTAPETAEMKAARAVRIANANSVCKRSSPYCGSYSPAGKTDAQHYVELADVRERVAAAYKAEE